MYKWILVLGIPLFYSGVVFSATSTNTVITRPCTIFVYSHKNSGEQAVSYFTTKLRSRMECITLAQIHYPNYDSDTVRAKRVVYMWDYTPKPKKYSAATKRAQLRPRKIVAAFRRR